MLRLSVVRAARRFLVPKEKLFSTSVDVIEDGKNTLFEKLSQEFSDASSIIKSLKKKEELKAVHFDEWKSRIDFLQTLNFSVVDCFKMISKHPPLLKIPLDDLQERTRLWYGCDLGPKSCATLLVFQPILFETKVETIKKRIPFLRLQFRKGHGLSLLLLDCPNIMFDEWQSVLDKYSFLSKEEAFNMGDLIQSKALKFSLDFIKMRLLVLKRCGVFKTVNLKPHKRNKYDKSEHVNPPLRDILIENDEIFAKDIAGISLEEYVVCTELYNAFGEDDAKIIVDDDDDEEEEEEEEEEEGDKKDNHKITSFR